MVEIKISLSDEMDNLVQRICASLGIKKTEYVKSLVIENLKQMQISHSNKEGKRNA